MKCAQPSAGSAALPEPPLRFEALDSWRGVCALLVVVFHAPVVGVTRDVAFFRHGFVFVDFFFVLSGFVITHAFYERLRGGQGLGRFCLTRFLRVYPLHLIMLLAFAAFQVVLFLAKGEAAFTGAFSLPAFGENLALLQAFGGLDQLTWNYPSWSISAEFAAYVLFGILAFAVPRLLFPLMAAIAAIGLGFLAVRVGHIDTSYAYGWVRGLAGFAVGCVLRGRLWQPDALDRARADGRAAWTVTELACLGLVAVYVGWLGDTVASVLAPLVFGYVVYVFSLEGGHVSRFLRCRPLAFLGAVSYSIYLTHAFLLARLENVVTVLSGLIDRPITVEADGQRLVGTNALEGGLALLGILAAAVAVSVVTHRLVERPGIRLGRRLGARLTQRKGATPGHGAPAPAPVAKA